jgi:hypothetical protein
MIDLDFSTFLAVAAAVMLSLFFLVWLMERPRRKKELFLEPKHIWFCTVCTYTYINTKDEIISVCPRCGGFNKKA